MSRVHSITCALALFLSLSSVARAEEGIAGLQATLDEPIVSTASKSAETATVAPATITTITAEDLRRYGIKSLDEAIDFISLGMMTANPLHSVDIGSRGVLFTGDFGPHVLLLVNGHIMNEPWNGTAYYERGAAIPFELIDHIEIILGPGSVLYGSNAMLGVINIITKKAKDYSGVRVIAEGELSPAVGQGNALRSPSFKRDYWGDVGRTGRVALGVGHEFKLGSRPAEVTFQVEYFTHSGPTLTFGPQGYDENSAVNAPPGQTVWGGRTPNAYNTRVPSAYVRFVMGDFEVNLRAAEYRRTTPYVNRFNQFIHVFDSPHDFERDRWLSGDVRYRTHISKKTMYSQRFYGDVYEFYQEANSAAPDDCTVAWASGCQNKIIGKSRWMGSEAQLTTDWSNDGRYVTLLGVDGRLRRVAQVFDQSERATGFSPGAITNYSRNESLLALYAQQALSPIRPLHVNVGARGDFDPRFGSKLSPRAAVGLDLWPGGTLKGIYSTAFRAPSAYELFFVDPAAQVASPGLRPETVRSIEGSIEQKFGTQKLLFGVFRSWWRDMVLLEEAPQGDIDAAKQAGTLNPDATGVYQYRNVAGIDNFGFNAAYEGMLGVEKLRYGLTVTSAYARRNFTDGRPSLPLTVAPSFFGNARISYDFGVDRGLPIIALAGHWLGSRPVDRAYDAVLTNSPYTPVPYARPLVELRATVSGPLTRQFSYRFTVNYSFAARGPYVAGPNQLAVPGGPPLETAPIDRLRLGLLLEYVLP